MTYGARLLLATGAMAGTVLWLAPAADAWLDWAWQQRALWIVVVCSAGIAAYVVALVVLGIRPRHLRSPVREEHGAVPPSPPTP